MSDFYRSVVEAGWNNIIDRQRRLGVGTLWRQKNGGRVVEIVSLTMGSRGEADVVYRLRVSPEIAPGARNEWTFSDPEDLWLDSFERLI